MKAIFSTRPYLYSLIIIVLLGLWIYSGHVDSKEPAFVPDTQNTKSDKPGSIETDYPKVRTRDIPLNVVTRSVTLFARTEPDRQVTLKAETVGPVDKLLSRHGDRVDKGAVILDIDMQQRSESLSSGKLALKQRQLEYQGAKKLSTRGFQNQVQLAKARAALQDAVTRVSTLEIDIDKTHIRAPFSGVIAEKYVDKGDYLAPGDPVVTLVDLDPLVVRADVTQGDITSLRAGQNAQVSFLDGTQIEGKIRYLSSVADAQTNTFRIEVEIPNADYSLLAGMSAELTILLGETRGILISPSLLSLNSKGIIGLKSVVDNVVVFSSVEVVKTEADGIWVSGPQNTRQVIVVGQGFVRDGDRVSAVAE